MARPTLTPRASAIDPADFARRVVQLAAARTSLTRPEDHASVPLGRDAELIAGYARGELPDDGDAAQRLGRVCYGLHGAPADEAPADLGSTVGVIVLAARGRLKLEASPMRDVTTSEFAAMAGLDTSTVRRLVREEKLKRAGFGKIKPDSARRHLSGAATSPSSLSLSTSPVSPAPQADSAA